MDNILYLDDYINLYNKKNNKIIKVKPYDETISFGKIIDREKFIKNYETLLINNKLNKNILGSNITVIINGLYSKEDKKIIKEVLEELNYRHIKIINEKNILKLAKKKVIINVNYNFIIIYYLNIYGNVNLICLPYNNLIKKILKEIMVLFKDKKIYLIGQNYAEFIKYLVNDNYYAYVNSKDYLITKIIEK